jgi:hypothetical protein
MDDAERDRIEIDRLERESLHESDYVKVLDTLIALNAQKLEYEESALVEDAKTITLEKIRPSVLCIVRNKDPLLQRLEIALRKRELRPVVGTVDKLEEIASRIYPDFHFRGIILDSSDPEPHLRKILDRTKLPCCLINRTGKKTTYHYYNLDDAIQHVPLAEHERIVNGYLDATGTKPRLPPQDKQRTLELRQIELDIKKDRKNPQLHYEAGILYLMRGDFENQFLGIQHFEKALQNHPGHLPTLQALCYLVFEDEMKGQILDTFDTEQREPPSFENLRARVQESFVGYNLETLEESLGPSVIPHLFDKEQGKFSKAISVLDHILKNAPTNLDSQALLVYALIKRNQPGDRERAYDLTINYLAGGFDEPRGNLNVFRKMGDLKVGPRVLQLIGLHEVQELLTQFPNRLQTETIYYKIFTSPYKKSAQAEYTALSKLQDVELLACGTGERIFTPPAHALLSKGEEDPLIFLMNRQPGHTVANLASKDPWYAHKHLQWITDATAALQLWGKENLDLEPLPRDGQEIPLLGEVDFYTERIYSKFIIPFEKTNNFEGRKVKLSDRVKREMLEAFKPMGEMHFTCPEWLNLYHTDANLGQFLIHSPQNPASTFTDDCIAKGRKSRIDLEGIKIGMGFSDIITPLESEMWGERDAVSLSEDYIIRWLGHIIYEIWEKREKDDEEDKHFQQFAHNYQAGLDDFNTMRAAVQEGLPYFDPNVSYEQLMQYHKVASLARNLTVSGDKHREYDFVSRVIDNVFANPDTAYLHDFYKAKVKKIEQEPHKDMEGRPFLFFLQQQLLFEEGQRSPNHDNEVAFLELLALQEQLPYHAQHHLEMAALRADELEMDSFAQILRTNYLQEVHTDDGS